VVVIHGFERRTVTQHLARHLGIPVPRGPMQRGAAMLTAWSHLKRWAASYTRYMTHQARLEAIWIKRGKGGPMDPADAATLETGRGIVGNANRGGRRQVTIISRERWAVVSQALGVEIDPSTRRANLMVSGIDLEKSRGRIMAVGEVRLRINGETRPCWQMEEAQAGLQAAMDAHWGGGAFADVLEGGEIRIGNAVAWDLPLFTADSL
jgi:MOSC domain-containing protein YiiM